MSYSVQNIRNVCLLGHGGNGKTSLAESMLLQTGVIDRRFWAYLARLYTLSIGDGTTSASSDAAFASNRYLL